jgi:hypothetical protein
VNARIESGRLFVHEAGCPNLIAEAALYRYSDNPAERNAELPVDANNHALAALRYLIASLDDRRQVPRPTRPAPPARPQRRWLSLYNEALWNPL